MYVYSRVRGVEKMGVACSGCFALWQLPGKRGEDVGYGGGSWWEEEWVLYTRDRGYIAYDWSDVASV